MDLKVNVELMVLLVHLERKDLKVRLEKRDLLVYREVLLICLNGYQRLYFITFSKMMKFDVFLLNLKRILLKRGQMLLHGNPEAQSTI